MPWRTALERVLQTLNSPREGKQVRWAVVGSVASVLQGCHIRPGDLDLLAKEPKDVYRFAELMADFAPDRCEHPPGHQHWHSSAASPVTAGPDEYGFTWHFGRWHVDGFEVEMAHITAPEGFPTSSDGAGIWEAGPEIWHYVRTISFAGYGVPVVPLEIQLQTNLTRGLTERAEEIARVLRVDGYDQALIQQALSRERAGAFDALLHESASSI
jgi:hypothetical protein